MIDSCKNSETSVESGSFKYFRTQFHYVTGSTISVELRDVVGMYIKKQLTSTSNYFNIFVIRFIFHGKILHETILVVTMGKTRANFIFFLRRGGGRKI